MTSAELPRGVVTFLFTDVAGSTALWETAPHLMGPAMARHDALVEAAVTGSGGVLVRPRGEGDSRFAVFARASDAVAGALRVQQALRAEDWATPTAVAVRSALHTGEADVRDGDYYGRAVNRAARLRGLGHPGQVLLSQATSDLVVDRLPAGAALRDLGAHALPDLVRPELVFQLLAPGLPDDFPPLRSGPGQGLDVRLLGPVEASRGGQRLDLGSPERQAVLARLALEPGRTVPADELGPAAALRGHVSALRRALEPVAGRHTVLVARRPGWALLVAPGAVDLQRFEVTAADAQKELADGRFETAARGLSAALALWRGPALAGTPLAGSPAAARLEDLRLGVLEDLYDAELGCGRHAALVAPLEGLLAAHPERERLWAQLVLAQHRAGAQSGALAALERARNRLPVAPGPELLDLERRVRQLDPSLGGPPGAARRTVKLPTVHGPLLGREQEVAAVRERLVGGGARLVTLTGPGGSGKTRLAVEVATRAAADHAGGVFFVPLAGVSDPAAVLPAVAEVLEVVVSPDEPLAAAVAVSLAGRAVLLVLDNLEQLLAAAPVVADLLAAVPSLRVLATSRTALRLREEQEHPLAPLAVPEPGCPPQELMAYGAVQLFVARASAVRPDVDWDDAAQTDVAELCRRLDGLPLALELAAARTALLTPSELLVRLDSQLGLLVGGARDLPDRQRTLRATIDWSHDLLEPGPQRLLARLGVFTGLFDLATVEALAGPDVDDVLGDLAVLVDSSLVRREVRGGAGRFRLQQSVREYARERLVVSGEQDAVRHRLAVLLAERVAAAAPGLDGRQVAHVLSELRALTSELQAATDWALAAGQAELAGRLVVGLRGWWLLEGRLSEGRGRLAQVLASPLPDPLRARALLAAGILAYVQDDAASAEPLLEHARRLAAELGDEETAATAYGYLGALGLRAGRLDEGQAMADEALAVGLRVGAYETQTLALSLTAVVAALRADPAAERAAYLRRLELARGRGDIRRTAETLGDLAELALLVGDHLLARTFAEEALELARGTARLVTRDVLLTMARVELGDGTRVRAAVHAEQALRFSIELGQEFEVAQCLLVIAAVAAAGGADGVAAELYGAGSQLRGDLTPVDLELEPDLVAHRDRARGSLGDEAFARAVDLGTLLGRDRAVELALRVVAQAQPTL